MATFPKTDYILAVLSTCQILHLLIGKGNDPLFDNQSLINWSDYVQSELAIIYLIFNALCFYFYLFPLIIGNK